MGGGGGAVGYQTIGVRCMHWGGGRTLDIKEERGICVVSSGWVESVCVGGVGGGE